MKPESEIIRLIVDINVLEATVSKLKIRISIKIKNSKLKIQYYMTPAIKTERHTHAIDATDKSLGRLATEVAGLLRGKHKQNFVPNKDIGDFVEIKNFSKIKFTGKKMEQKKYYRHSGYLGGLKETPLEKLYQKNPTKIMVKAVWGMLPKNKLRKEQIKRLKVEM